MLIARIMSACAEIVLLDHLAFFADAPLLKNHASSTAKVNGFHAFKIAEYIPSPF